MSILKPLLSVVESMLREHEQLLALAKRKKDVLIKGDMQALNDMVKDETAFVHRIERLEAERLGAGRLIAIRLGIPVEQLTAEKVSALAETPEESDRMLQLTDGLRDVIAQLKQVNDLNKQLIEQSLQFVQNSIEVLTESPVVPTYGGRGETNSPYPSGRTSYFDSKA